ncbi:ribosomal L7Ae/L30e/S12e/Gadd45 family protein [Carnobacteriaceae bacterium zg-ZUI240]|nr:ribosomal L7Ae/L30e/S12e/Gadd45 family protein [Carnobacteriaceae bacterium zg-ZUI240]
MLNSQKQLNLFGLATRAGMLVSGEETVLSEVKKNKAKLVVIANDLSENTKKKMMDKCHYYKVDCIEQFTTIEMSQAIGKKRSILAFTDNGFANSFKKLAHINTIDENEKGGIG